MNFSPDRATLSSRSAGHSRRPTQPDSALAAYEQLVASREIDGADRQWVLPDTYRRLGDLYEAKGDKAKAIGYYRELVTLWKDADPVLQPVVQNIRRRMATLAGEPVRP